MNNLIVFLWLVEQDWCETILEQMWGSISLGRGGAFSVLKGQLHNGRTPGCQWCKVADGTLSSLSLQSAKLMHGRHTSHWPPFRQSHIILPFAAI